MRVYLAILALAIIVAIPHISDSFGHGLGGDVAPPLDLGGREVTVSTQLTPTDLSVGNVDDAAMAVKFYDVETNETFENVTYKIEIWQDKDLIARNLFFDKDGELDVTLRTKSGCTESILWKCTNYYGSEHPIAPGALYAQGSSNVIIQGPIFERGGLYNIKVGITAATSARTNLAEPLNYDTFISVADIQPFTIRTAQAEVEATIKTYYDKISNIEYNESRESLSFEMAFDWTPEYVELVQIVHEEIQVPKSFTVWSPEREYAGYVDGVRLDKRILIIDPYTYEDRNVIHFLITMKELQRINAELGPEHEMSDIMRFELVPESNIQKNTVEFDIVDGENPQSRIKATVNVSWDARAGSGGIPLKVTFFDESAELLRDTRYDYIVADSQTNEIIVQSVGDTYESQNVATEGIDVITVQIPSAGAYRLDLVMYGQGREGLDFDDKYAGIGNTLIEFGGAVPPQRAEPAVPTTGAIPSWIQRVVGLWADGTITDNEFVSGIEFLIQKSVITVSADREESATDGAIPSWIKKSAGIWADGITTDAEFVSSLEFLIQKGIIIVGES